MTPLNSQRITLIIVALSSILLGSSMLLMGHHRSIRLTTDFFSISSFASPGLFNSIAGLAWIVLGVMSVYVLARRTFMRQLGFAAIALSLLPLISLFSSSMWIEQLGGFPAIGSGQGVIKYAALMMIGVMMLGNNLRPSVQRLLAIVPTVMVLLWIGGMKFTQLEAQGIEPLVKTSPFMSWMYHVWSLQTASNLIGVYDLFAAGLLVLSLRIPKLVLPALVMCSAVFIMTQTFLFSWNAALSTESLLTTGGHFLIKDLWYLANLTWLLSLRSK